MHLESYRDYVLSESARNSDLMFLHRKLDRGNPYLPLAYWIANDRFAERIREMMHSNIDITNESVLNVMREIFLEYRHEVENGNEPDFNFALAKKVMRKLESVSSVEPWGSVEWDRMQWKCKIVFPNGYEDLDYLAEYLYSLDLRLGLIRAICSNMDILPAIHEYGKISSLDDLKTVAKSVLSVLASMKLYRDQSKQKRRFFKVKKIVDELDEYELKLSDSSENKS